MWALLSEGWVWWVTWSSAGSSGRLLWVREGVPLEWGLKEPGTSGVWTRPPPPELVLLPLPRAPAYTVSCHTTDHSPP